MNEARNTIRHEIFGSQRMSNLSRLKNIAIAKLAGLFPGLGRKLAEAYQPEARSGATPWTPLEKPLKECRVAMVTTAGIHHRSQQPFDMQDPDGDPSYRALAGSVGWDDFMITHDYYDHAHADKDPNIVLPLDRLREFASEGLIGGVAEKHYSFMGHITGHHIETLISRTAEDVADQLRSDQVDLVILSPG